MPKPSAARLTVLCWGMAWNCTALQDLEQELGVDGEDGVEQELSVDGEDAAQLAQAAGVGAAAPADASEQRGAAPLAG